MDIFVYTPTLELVGIVDSFSSFRWRRKYYEPGEMELHCSITTNAINTLQLGRIIQINGRSDAAIIESVELQEGGDLTVKGRMLSCCLDWCVIDAEYNFYNAAYADIIRNLIAAHGTGERLNPLLTLGDTLTTGTVTVQISHRELLPVIEKLARACDIGYRVRLDVANKKWVFDLYQGVDRTAEKHEDIAIFSDIYNDIANTKYTCDGTEYRNVAVVYGEGEGADRKKVIVDNSDGGSKRILYVDANDVRKEEGMSDADYIAALTARGQSKLGEHEKAENFESDILTTSQFEYKKDWDLGDVVTIKYTSWGKQTDQRICEVEEVYEKGYMQVTPVFGTPLPEDLNLDK